MKTHRESIVRARLAWVVMAFGVAGATALASCGGSAGGLVPGSAEESEEEAPFEQDVVTKTDAAIEAELKRAAEGALYMSEGDFPFEVVRAPLPPGQRTVTAKMVRDGLASYVDADDHADKPLATLNAMSGSFAEWRSDFRTCADREGADPAQCPRIHALNEVLARNLRGVKMFYFGAQGREGYVEGTGVSLFIVGRTPRGTLLGVRTVAIWT